MHPRTKSIIEDYNNGLDRWELVNKYDISMSSLHKLFSNHNIKVWDKKQTRTIGKEKVLELHSKGYNARAIAKKMRVSRAKVESIMKKEGLIIIKIKHETIINLWKEGLKPKQIAEKLNTSLFRVYQSIKREKMKSDKYFNPKYETGSYAKLFYEFNK